LKFYVLLLTVEEKLEIRTMSRKVNISVDNLPDTLRGQIHGVESAIDNESLALFTDNKDVRVSIENAAHGLRAYSNTFNHYDLWGRFVRSGHKKLPVEEAPKKTIVTRYKQVNNKEGALQIDFLLSKQIYRVTEL
jgi:hypothetical protein